MEHEAALNFNFIYFAEGIHDRNADLKMLIREDRSQNFTHMNC